MASQHYTTTDGEDEIILDWILDQSADDESS
jgi:hypothetical protein